MDITDEQNTDLKEIEKGLQTVSNKSRLLYENALNKIKQINEELSSNNNAYLDNMVHDDLSKEAIEILKDWLTPEGE